MSYTLDNPLPYNERPENWERHGGIKVSVINDDCIMVGDEIIHEGDEIWTESNYRWLIDKANDNCRPDQFVCVDTTCDNIFVFKASHGISAAPFMIIKKKTNGKKKLVPFDFYLKEDRNAVIGKCLIRKHSGNPDDEFMVVGFSENAACFSRDIVDAGNNILDHYGTGEELFEQFSFQNGDPVGKEVEE